MKKDNNIFTIVVLAILLLLNIVTWVTVYKCVEDVLWCVLSLVGVTLNIALFVGVLVMSINDIVE